MLLKKTIEIIENNKFTIQIRTIIKHTFMVPLLSYTAYIQGCQNGHIIETSASCDFWHLHDY